jgi:hypothetical protein
VKDSKPSVAGSSIDQRVKRWRQLIAARNPLQVDSIRIIESNAFSPQLIELDRVIAFIGLHGTGKTLLLRMIEAAFGYITPVYLPPFVQSHFLLQSPIPQLEGIIEVRLNTPLGSIIRTIDLSQSEEQRRRDWGEYVTESFVASYVDPYGALNLLSYMYDNYDFSSKVGEQERQRNLTRAELDSIRNILGRTYEKITLRSACIDDGNPDDIHIPFITGVLGSRSLDNTAMSQGELWVHYVSWFLENELNEGGLALIDEPEAFLAARGRRPFIDHVAYHALRRHLQIIVGTHSPEVISRFPLENIRMCIPGKDGISVLKPKSLVQIRDYIGIETSVRGIALVEDDLAKRLLGIIFAQHDTALTREIEIVSVGGESEVVNGLRILGCMSQLKCFGVLDADQRSQSQAAPGALKGPGLFLPGSSSPEDELLASALEHVQWIAEMMTLNVDSIIAAVNTSNSLDHQYRLPSVAKQLGCTEEVLTYVLAQAWLRQINIAKEAQNLAITIRKLISV